MKKLAACLALPLTVAAAAGPQLPDAPPPAPQEPAVLPDPGHPLDLRLPWLQDSVVEQAVRATLAELPSPGNGNADLLRSAAATKFARDVDYARVPGCLRSDGLKFQSTRLGPFTVHGIRAAFPFMIIAKLRGKCD